MLSSVHPHPQEKEKEKVKWSLVVTWALGQTSCIAEEIRKDNN